MQSQESGAVEVGVEVGVEGAQPSCPQNHNQVILARVSELRGGKFTKVCARQKWTVFLRAELL